MDLMNLLPPYYDENVTMEKLQGIVSVDINTLADGFTKTIDQCFVGTATDLISRYEKIYGIEIDVTKSDAVRRDKIKAKMAGTGTFTIKMLLNYLRSFPGGSAVILEYSSLYKFRIKFNDYYRVPDIASIIEMHAITDELKPAHLAYDHTFTYNWWGMEDTGVWNDGGTWDDLRNYEEV